jgi:integrase
VQTICKPKIGMKKTHGIITNKKAFVKVVLFTSKTLANGEHPLVLRINKNKVRKHISIGVNCLPKYWDITKQAPKINHPKRNEVIALINKFERDFSDKIHEYNFQSEEYTIDQLVSAVLESSKNIKEIQVCYVADYIDNLVQTLKEEKRMGTAKSNNDCKLMLFKFYPKKNLTFQEIDYLFLTKWESFMRKNSFKETSMAVYFRTLRSIINKAINEGVISKTNYTYPFDRFKVSKFDLTTKKRALTKEDIIKIYNYPVKEGSKMSDCHKIFMFSYFNQGMNYIDIAKLRWSNISKLGIMEYNRQKTGCKFSIQLGEQSLQILECYRKLSGYDSNNYVFPILDKAVHITPQQIQNRLIRVIKQVNINMKLIGAALEIETPITTYVARHTYATVLKRSGVSTSIISNALGHESESITQTYLADFESNVFFEANKNLL